MRCRAAPLVQGLPVSKRRIFFVSVTTRTASETLTGIYLQDVDILGVIHHTGQHPAGFLLQNTMRHNTDLLEVQLVRPEEILLAANNMVISERLSRRVSIYPRSISSQMWKEVGPLGSEVHLVGCLA